MYAVKNPLVEVQIATRPRNWYSTITQITVVWMLGTSPESFTTSLGGVFGPTTNTISTDATVSVTGGGSTWTISHNSSPSFIRITESSYGFSLQIQGHQDLFAGSVGMCGNWDLGNVRFSNGTLYDTSGGFFGTAATSYPLAVDWQIDMVDNQLDVPTTICDADSDCGPTYAFACNAVRRLEDEPTEVHPGCTSKCEDLSIESSVKACEQDVALTGDESWACQKTYQDPLISNELFCDYCTGLEKCLAKAWIRDLKQLWNCLTKPNEVKIPYGIETIDELTKQCCTCNSDIAESEICNPPDACDIEHETDGRGRPCDSKHCAKLGGKCMDSKKCNKLVKKVEDYKDYICLGNKICGNRSCRCLIEKACPGRED